MTSLSNSDDAMTLVHSLQKDLKGPYCICLASRKTDEVILWGNSWLLFKWMDQIVVIRVRKDTFASLLLLIFHLHVLQMCCKLTEETMPLSWSGITAAVLSEKLKSDKCNFFMWMAPKKFQTMSMFTASLQHKVHKHLPF